MLLLFPSNYLPTHELIVSYKIYREKLKLFQREQICLLERGSNSSLTIIHFEKIYLQVCLYATLLIISDIALAAGQLG